MGILLAEAERLLETASVDSDEELVPSDMALLVDHDGGIRLMDASDWKTERLRTHSGAATLYRISRNLKRIRVEGLSGLRSCVVETERPAAVARQLLGGVVSHWYSHDREQTTIISRRVVK